MRLILATLLVFQSGSTVYTARPPKFHNLVHDDQINLRDEQELYYSQDQDVDIDIENPEKEKRLSSNRKAVVYLGIASLVVYLFFVGTSHYDNSTPLGRSIAKMTENIMSTPGKLTRQLFAT